jgi:hypothetical protein
MAVYSVNLVIYTGTDFEQTFVLADDSNALLNLSGYTVAARMKRHGKSSSSVALNASVSDATGGRIRVNLSDTETYSLTPGRYYYDIVITKNGTTDRVVEGEVFVKKAVTR